MMYIALNKDGTYNEYKKIEKIYSNIDQIKYVVLSNSTELKGPLYTIVNTKSLHFENDDVNVSITVEYDSTDCPCSDESVINSTIRVDSIERHYSIYPLIKQMMMYNYFIDDFVSDGPSINIYNVKIEGKKFSFSISNSVDDKSLESAFSNLHMTTCVSKLTKYINFIIFDTDGRWYVTKHAPKHFNLIGIEIVGAESLYILSEDEYYRFASIRNLSFEMNDESIYNDGYYGDIVNDREGNEIFSCRYNTILGILQACVYIPQMLLLERQVYKNTVSMNIFIDTKAVNYKLNITEKEVRGGICIFDALNKLLKM